MLSPSVLHIDCAVAVRHIEESICEAVYHRLHRKGIVVGVSGGVDSGVVAAVAARALGSDRVIGLVMPDADSASESAELAQMLGQALGIRMIVEDVTATLAAAGCYRRRDEAIRSVVPEYDDGYRCKIVLPDLVTLPGYPLYAVVVRSPSGEERRVRLPLDAYLGIVAATNFKQRVRKMMEYYYADRFRFAVAGTANRLEHDQGFIVQKAVRHIPFRPLDVGKLCFLRFEGVPHIAPSMLRGRATVRRGTSADIAERRAVRERRPLRRRARRRPDRGL